MTWIIQENITGFSIKEECKNSTRQDSLVCTINKSGYLKEKAPANARLIAAAPELLEILEEIVCLPIAREYPDGPCLEKGMMDDVRKAIAKAKGQL